MTVTVASLTDKSAAELTGKHRSWSPADGAQTNHIGHRFSLPQGYEFFP